MTVPPSESWASIMNQAGAHGSNVGSLGAPGSRKRLRGSEEHDEVGIDEYLEVTHCRITVATH